MVHTTSTSTPPTLPYRHDIDGLRALAVLSVVCFHSKVFGFSGGFLGVDIFFVISGYLISSLIFLGQDKGTFSLINFYERRARRILPALCVVMITCIPFACWWMFPEQLNDFWESIATASLSVSNLLFWVETSYFAAIAEEKPLLHTWSLGIEEQFYLLFPLVLYLTGRINQHKRTIFLSILAITLGSLLLSEWGWRVASVANFYLLPFRAWEISLGILVAWLKLYHIQRIPTHHQHIAANIGLAIVILSILTFRQHTPNPSLATLIPLLGTVFLLIYEHPHTLSYRLLQQPLLRHIGKISYSAYLWHQPILAFLHLRFANLNPHLSTLLTFTLTFLLAELSWRYIEQPFRNPQRIKRPWFIVATISTVSMLIIIGSQGYRLTSAISRYTLAEQSFDSHYHVDDTCDNQPASQACHYGASDNQHIALIGDSHAHALAYELGKALEKEGEGMYIHVRGGCPPITGIRIVTTIYTQKSTPPCGEYNENITRYVSNSNSIDTIILAANWKAYLPPSTRMANASTQSVWGWRSWFGSYSSHIVTQKYQAMVAQWLTQGKQVILIYPIPEAQHHIPHYLLQQARYHTLPQELTHSYADFMAKNAGVYQAFEALYHPRLRHIKPADNLCEDAICFAYKNGNAFYYDDDHLSSAGAQLLVPTIIKQLQSFE